MKIRKNDQAGLIRQYKTGYRRKPESKWEVKTAEAIAVWLIAAHYPPPEKLTAVEQAVKFALGLHE